MLRFLTIAVALLLAVPWLCGCSARRAKPTSAQTYHADAAPVPMVEHATGRTVMVRSQHKQQVTTTTRSTVNGSQEPGRQTLIGIYLPIPGGFAIKGGLEYDMPGDGPLILGPDNFAARETTPTCAQGSCEPPPPEVRSTQVCPTHTYPSGRTVVYVDGRWQDVVEP